jgi:hypothetical protein
MAHRLFDNDDLEMPRQAGEQVLGSLEYEVPPQVAKHDDRWR